MSAATRTAAPTPKQRLLESSIGDWIAFHAQVRPAHVAVVARERRMKWAELDARVNRVASALLAMGVTTGDKVALLSSNRIEALEVLFGTLRAGCVIVPLSPLSTMNGWASTSVSRASSYARACRATRSVKCSKPSCAHRTGEAFEHRIDEPTT